ncbi:MFS transporter [Corynebacterium aquatimens]|uniref:MFS family permease n=1 Tax=Corynebacterium aquatimens TaxID=1190508 RepID=A0A931DTZ1_9CORY|nr:MFS transporter [Corynebacterium aquatimens]MBG6121419.1 MFS family permease [Corynebacterium aquatimens]WJY66037.1 Antiseptic resistance protein [Corynebacterium aquatimens]
MTDTSHRPVEGAGVRRGPWNALAVVSIGYVLIMLDQGIMPVVTPHLPAANANDAVWLTSIYLLATVVPMPITGRLGDKYGQRRVYIIGLALYAVSLTLAALPGSGDQWWRLVVARALQGLGAAIFLPQAFGMINRVFRSDGRGKAFAAWGVIGSIGSLVGPILGGYLIGAFGWQSAFTVQAVIAVVGVIVASAWLPQLHATPVRLRVTPLILSFCALTSLVWGIQSRAGWLILLGCGLIAVLVATERSRSSDEAFLPFELLRNRNFALGTAAISCMGFAVASMFIPIMYWLQSGAGISASMAGWLTAPMSVMALVLTPYAGVLADKVDPRVLNAAGFAVMAAGLLCGWAIAVAGANPLLFALVTTLLGVGSAFVWAPNATTTMRDVPESVAGAASGLYNTLRQVGSVVGVAMVGAVMGRAAMDGAAVDGSAVGESSISAMLVPAIAMVAGAILSLFLRDDLLIDGRSDGMSESR